jgi:hypothetical protein
MIIEGIVTTRNDQGEMHFAPMGAIVVDNFAKLILRPFPGSNTFKNLARQGDGVFHSTDDANLIAYSAVGEPWFVPKYRNSDSVSGFLLTECCRAYEFKTANIDTRGERSKIEVDVVQVHHFRDFIGFNRAKHAILEAAILATRFHLLNLDEVATEFRKLRIIIDKTGTPAEDDTMQMLERKLAEARSK